MVSLLRSDRGMLVPDGDAKCDTQGRYDEIHELLTFLMLDILRSPQHFMKILLFLPQILLEALLLLLDTL